jgi:hypothetical protein
MYITTYRYIFQKKNKGDLQSPLPCGLGSAGSGCLGSWWAYQQKPANRSCWARPPQAIYSYVWSFGISWDFGFKNEYLETAETEIAILIYSLCT